MQEYELKILDRYALNVKSTRRVRGAFFARQRRDCSCLKRQEYPKSGQMHYIN